MDREGEHQRTTVKASSMINDIKTGGLNHPRDKPIGSLPTGWAVSGVEVARARSGHFRGTAGTRTGMPRETAK